VDANKFQGAMTPHFEDWRYGVVGEAFFARIEEMIKQEEKKKVTKLDNPGATAMATARKESYAQALEDVLAIRI